jgi:hypothetical protein
MKQVIGVVLLACVFAIVQAGNPGMSYISNSNLPFIFELSSVGQLI